MCVPIVMVPKLAYVFLERFKRYIHKAERANPGQYLTGLMGLVNKIARGISMKMFNVSDSSNLTRCISRGTWESDEVNRLRLEKERERFAESSPRRGTLAIDDLLVEKSGKHIALCSTHYEHGEGWRK